ncbi:MAG: hypothetical protein GY862_32155 [Gammaproteobacteria bacterium]|nr:hypothetical protein [Gammaproteobacteria bacterium]
MQPALGGSFSEDREKVSSFLANNNAGFEQFLEYSAQVNQRVPRDILQALYPVLCYRQAGVTQLGLAAVEPLLHDNEKTLLHALPAPPVPANQDEKERRMALLRLWVQLAVFQNALLLPNTPGDWLDSDEGPKVKRISGRFEKPLKNLLGSRWYKQNLTQVRGGQDKPWLGFLKRTLGENETANGFFLNASKISLIQEAEINWRRCTTLQPASSLAGENCAVSGCGGRDGAVQRFPR